MLKRYCAAELPKMSVQLSFVAVTKMMLSLQRFKARLASLRAPSPHPVAQLCGVFQSAC